MPSHLRFPIAVTSSGRLATVDQDSDADIVQSVALLLDTRPGDRRSVPDYGLPDPVFGGVLPAHLTELINTWEERADMTLVDQLTAGITQEVDVHPSTSGPGDYEIDTSDPADPADPATNQTTGVDAVTQED